MPIHDHPSEGSRASGGNEESASERLRGRLAVAVVLLGVTLLASWAAGRVGGPDPGASPRRFEASAGPVHFRGQLDRTSVLLQGDGLFGVELVLSADAGPGGGPRIPADLVVVLDRSGSMQGRPLADAVASVRDLIGRLEARDRFALVTYASDAALVVPLEEGTAGNRDRWLATLEQLVAGGGTNMAIGLDLAADTLLRGREPGRMPLAILVSDGHANEGDHSMEGLRARAGRAVAGEYVLSAVGVGSGFDEALMSALADAGTGNFYYVQDGSDLGDVFSGEFLSARDTVASSLSVEIDLGDGVELLDAAGYPVERSGRTARFRPGTLFAGQERRVWLSLRAPTDALRDVDAGELRLTWRDPNASPAEAPRVLRIAEPLRVACVADERVFAASLDRDLVPRGLAGDKLAALKQGVASSVRLGLYDEARRRIEAFRLQSRSDYGRLGLAPEEQGALREVEALELDVKDAFASPASPAARNALSKTLSSEGQDGRRPGAKRQN